MDFFSLVLSTALQTPQNPWKFVQAPESILWVINLLPKP